MKQGGIKAPEAGMVWVRYPWGSLRAAPRLGGGGLEEMTPWGLPHLLRRPEGRLGLLVHLPDVVVLDGEHDEAAGVLPQQRLVLLGAPGALRRAGSG